MRMIQRLVREPLVQFLILGGILFLFAGYNDDTDVPADNEIIVSEGTIESLAMQWQRTWQRPPTAQELEGLVEDYIREELYYREARRMGLDQNDTIIRRRLRQKMEFIAEELAESKELDGAELQAYFDANADTYRRPDRYTFAQVYFNTDKMQEGLEHSVSATVDALNSGRVAADAVSDPTLLPAHMAAATASEVRANFGEQFLDGLNDTEPGAWIGPVRSSMGLHAVFLEERIEGVVPPLADVRIEVERDWYAEQRAAAKDQLVNELRKNYEVKVEYPEWAAELGQ